MIFERITFKFNYNAKFVTLYTKNFALPVSTAAYKMYQAVNAGSAVYKIVNCRRYQKCSLQSCVHCTSGIYCLCTLHYITYPDVVYKVVTAAILIQTRGVQSVISLEKSLVGSSKAFKNFQILQPVTRSLNDPIFYNMGTILLEFDTYFNFIFGILFVVFWKCIFCI